MTRRNSALFETLLPMAFLALGFGQPPASLTFELHDGAAGGHRPRTTDVRTGGNEAALGKRGARAEIYQFRLRGTSQAPGASGLGILTLAPSPFGIAVMPDGFLVYELELATSGLLVRKDADTKSHVVWMTTPELDRFEKLGVLGESGKWRGPLSGMNKFLLLVSLEDSPDVAERRGPVLVRGVSPSGLLVSYDNHELFSNMPHPE